MTALSMLLYPKEINEFLGDFEWGTDDTTGGRDGAICYHRGGNDQRIADVLLLQVLKMRHREEWEVGKALEMLHLAI